MCSSDLGVAKSKRQVGFLTMFTGVAVFIESNLSVLLDGLVVVALKGSHIGDLQPQLVGKTCFFVSSMDEKKHNI